jgi:urease accessory protein
MSSSSFDQAPAKPETCRPTTWLLLQLADATFPTGGFAHSQGLEAAWQLGHVRDLGTFVDESVWQTGTGALPFVRAGVDSPGLALRDVDAACDAFLVNHVANRASRAQGRALLSTVTRAFEGAPATALLAEDARGTCMHHAPLFGRALASLGLGALDVQTLWLHGALRSTLSAAVRLGAVGPLEAQRMHAERAALLSHVLEACSELSIDEASHSAPLADVYAALHDQLYARLFQS